MKLSAMTAALTIALLSASIASAAAPVVSWSVNDMKTAVRALGYPKPHPRKLACHGQGTAAAGRFDSFQCIATYRRHRRTAFYIQGQGEGGWLCAGKTLAGCKLLKHGFVTTAAVTTQGLGPSVDLAARGYMGNKYGSYQAQGFCSQTTTSTWSCPFVGVTLTVTFTHAKGGYVTSASAS